MIEISIIIPVYNAGKYLYDTLESVKQQTFTEWECICINDGSKDNSVEVINRFTATDNRFRLIDQKNQGVSVARNAGLDASKGNYIAFLDQDDLMSPTALESLFVLAKKYNADLVRGRRINIPDNYQLNELNRIKPAITHRIISSLNELNFRILPRRWMYVWLCLFKKEILSDIRFYEPLKSGAEDNIFMFEVFNKISEFIQSQNIVCLHRKSLTSTTQNGLKLSHIRTIEIATNKFNELVSINTNKLSRYLYKKQMRNFFHGSVYKSLESEKFIIETQDMLKKIYPDIKHVLKLKHKIIAYFFIRNKIKTASFFKTIIII
ncbi:MAG: glycosyltransferase [Paludibacter sp.]|nr:glycosyltransferase [Paludibacter sp.]